ncbi:MAG: DEAD/DEAH box helicase family protein [Methylococcaceae bacterium]
MSELELANALTVKTQQLCIGLAGGVADIIDLVTPTTAELLRWWFGEEACTTRRLNFHDGQRQAILNTIVAHEVPNATNLKNLYQQAAPDALLTGTGKTWVLQALLIWQLLNKNAALAEGLDDARFTRHFLVVAPA